MLWIGSGRFDGRIGDGDGPRACRGPDAGIEADGKVRPGVTRDGTGLVPPLVPTWYPLEWRNLRLNCQWHTKAVCRTLGFRPPRVLHAYWWGRATRPIIDHR